MRSHVIQSYVPARRSLHILRKRYGGEVVRKSTSKNRFLALNLISELVSVCLMNDLSLYTGDCSHDWWPHLFNNYVRIPFIYGLIMFVYNSCME